MMPPEASGDSPNISHWIGWGLILLGVGVLLLSTENRTESQEQAGLLTRGRRFSSGYLDRDWSRRVIGSVISLLSLVILLRLLRRLIHFFAVHGPIPAGEFSPALATGVILGTGISLVGHLTDVWSTRVAIRLADSNGGERDAHWLLRVATVLPIGVLALGAAIVVIGYAYSPVQYLITPSIVDHPLGNIGRWQPKETTTINILAGLGAAIVTVIFRRIQAPIWRWVRASGTA